MAVGSPVPSLCPISCHPCLSSAAPHPAAPALQPLRSQRACTALRYGAVSVAAACYCYQRQATATPCKHKQRQNKLATDTWSIRGIAVTAKQSKIKLWVGQKLSESKLGKSLAWGLANPAQHNPAALARNSNAGSQVCPVPGNATLHSFIMM